jgi:hypothetical protein
MSTIVTHGTPGKAVARPVNRLNAKQMYQLCKFIEQSSSAWTHETTRDSVGREASLALHFEVNRWNVQTAMESMELSFPTVPKTDVQKLDIVKSAVESLYNLMGVPLPEAWSDLK